MLPCFLGHLFPQLEHLQRGNRDRHTSVEHPLPWHFGIYDLRDRLCYHFCCILNTVNQSNCNQSCGCGIFFFRSYFGISLCLTHQNWHFLPFPDTAHFLLIVAEDQSDSEQLRNFRLKSNIFLHDSIVILFPFKKYIYTMISLKWRQSVWLHWVTDCKWL